MLLEPSLDLKSLSFVDPTGSMAADSRWRGFKRSVNKVFFLRYAAKCNFCGEVFEARPSRLSHHFLAPKESGYICQMADEAFLESYRQSNEELQLPKKNFYSVQEKKDIIDLWKNNNNDINIIHGLGYDKVTKKLISKWIDDLRKVDQSDASIANSTFVFEIEVNQRLDELREREGRGLNLKTIRK